MRIGTSLPVLFALAGCAHPVGLDDDETIVELDSKADVASRLDLGRMDLFQIAPQFSPQRVRVFVRGVLGCGGDDATAIVAVGSLDEMRGLRHAALHGDARDALEVQAAQSWELGAAELERGAWLDTTASLQGAYGLVFARDPEVRGEISALYRIAIDFDSAAPLPAAGEGNYEVFRPGPSAFSTDRWFVPVADRFDLSFAPTVRVVIDGTTSYAAHYVCDADRSSHDVRRQIESRGSVTPSCPNTLDESGRLYLEVDYDRSYVARVEIR